jgi:TetR/AcrR family transcriptional regulator, acrAB operon repressor
LEGKYLAIIVDKVQKRRDIAHSCTDLILEKGMKKLTVAEVAKTAGVSKGSIYDYFKNKEDIVFEVIRGSIQEYHDELMERINEGDQTTREKIFFLFDFVLNEDGLFNKKHNFYKEYISINLSSDNEDMCQFNKECSAFFNGLLKTFIEEGIKKGELVENSINLINGLKAAERGYLFFKWTEKADISQNFRLFLNTIFDLIEVKSDC